MRETSNVAFAIDIWTIPLGEPRCALILSEVLSEDEAVRAARFRFEKDRVHWTNARSALRSILATYVGEAPESLCFICNKNGKPELKGHAAIQFNLSHAGEFALIAVSKSEPVGIDIERIRPEVDIAALLGRIGEENLPPEITELYQRWTRREARVKAIGGQLFQPPPPEIQAIDLPAPEGYTASLAALDVAHALVRAMPPYLTVQQSL